MRSIVQNRFACSWKTVATNRRLWACSRSARAKPARRSSVAKLSAAITHLSSRIANVNPQRIPNLSASSNRARSGFGRFSHFKSGPRSEGLRLAHCPTYHRIDGVVAALQMDDGPGGGYVEIRLQALPGSREERDMRSTTAQRRSKPCSAKLRLDAYFRSIVQQTFEKPDPSFDELTGLHRKRYSF